MEANLFSVEESFSFRETDVMSERILDFHAGQLFNIKCMPFKEARFGGPQQAPSLNALITAWASPLHL